MSTDTELFAAEAGGINSNWLWCLMHRGQGHSGSAR